MRATAYEVMTTCAPAMVSSSPRPALLRVRSTTTVRSDGANRAASLSQVGHDEHRVAELAALVRPQHHREHLQRLAQAHVVGEHPAEPAVPEQRQPAEAVDLVGPQRGVEPRGQLGRLDRVEVQQRADGT
jgi:septal ring-binding cell division protein DamX